MSDGELMLGRADAAMPRVLIIAGSDSGGGAGIQADIKTVTAMGGHAMTAITAITAQNTLGVNAVHPVPPAMVLAQIQAVVDDIGIDAIKIGMLPNVETVQMVAAALAALGTSVPLILDPVLVATSGDALAGNGVAEALIQRLAPVATLVTPNLPELAALGGEARLRGTGAAVLVKGGHAPGPIIVDRLIHADGREQAWADPRIETRHTHGTGCTLASAIAVAMGHRVELQPAVALARRFVRAALREAPGLGQGHGPMGQGAVRVDRLLADDEGAGAGGGITATTRS